MDASHGSHYDPFGNPPKPQPDNHYALKDANNPDLFQCSIELIRTEDNSFDAALIDWKNAQTGTLDSRITFEYVEIKNTQAAYFKWDSDSEGEGRGPATDVENPLRFCKDEKMGNSQTPE
ncbi:hypothetical protein MMC11_007522 [Xylographa trunciseda]|nr:hypothetical protein [Xylographa trunciseda]